MFFPHYPALIYQFLDCDFHFVEKSGKIFKFLDRKFAVDNLSRLAAGERSLIEQRSNDGVELARLQAAAINQFNQLLGALLDSLPRQVDEFLPFFFICIRPIVWYCMESRLVEAEVCLATINNF